MTCEAPSSIEFEDRKLFAARLTPHRSLTRGNFRLLFLIFSGASLFSSLLFVIMGAWPVAGFMGLDVAIFYFAFRANFNAARAYEDVHVTPFELLFAKVSASGRRAEWRFNPAWVRLEREDDEEFGTLRLALVTRGKSVEIGSFLGPGEKADFASELARALAEARRGPRFS